MSEPIAPRLPLELWINILSHLTRPYLFNVSAVSRFFHALSAPLLFSEFRFHPGASVERQISGTRVRWELDRLEFWSSDEIAPHVQNCFLSLYSTSMELTRRESSPPLGVALFEAVSRFKNLRSLSCNLPNQSVELPALRVEALTRLEKVEINAGRLSPIQNLTAPRLKVVHFSYTDIPQLIVSQPPCLAMLDPVRLRSLELSPFHPFGLENFLGDGSTMSVFYNLRTLRLTLRSTAFTRVHASVAPFPAIRELIVHVNGACRADAIPTTSLASHLERYRGPAVLLPLVLACSGPEELIVTHGTAAEVLEALQTARHPDFITALSMRVKLYTDVRTSTVLQDILVLCPCLSRLTLEISSDGGIPTDSEGLELPSLCARLVEILRVQNPLETLVFRWRLGWEAFIVPGRSELEAVLRPAIPTLKHVFFTGRL